MNDVSAFKCSFIGKLEIWAKADNFRKEHWPENILPIDMEQIIEMRLGLSMEPVSDLPRELDVDAFLKRDYSGVQARQGVVMRSGGVGKYQNP